MPTGQRPTETNGPIDAKAIDYGVVSTKISKMNWPERDNLQKEIRDHWPQVAVNQSIRFGSVRGDGIVAYSHYFAPLGFLVSRFYR